MKQLISIVLLIVLLIPAVSAQQKKRDKVKRKYRKVEQVAAETQPPVFLRGKIRDHDDNLLPGATVVVVETKKGVNVNEKGEYFFYGLPTGRTRIQVSFAGYKTKSVDFHLQTGQNYLNFTLDEDPVRIDALSVTTQKRNQQLLDVPVTMNVFPSKFLEETRIRNLDELSEFVSGARVNTQGAVQPEMTIRGITSDETTPGAQSRVSVFYNNVPVNRLGGATSALFDMQQVDVLKGPQGTLFGSNASAGAIHFISNKPAEYFDGFLSAGAGNFNQHEITGFMNIPVFKKKLMLRAAGMYDVSGGYIRNTSGGMLNGNNTLAGRFSVRFIPGFKNSIDLVLNVQRDDHPGLGFMSINYPNAEGSTNPFRYVASLEQGKNLGIDRNVRDATLTMKHFNNENNFWTSTSSYRDFTSSSLQDGDGTAAPAFNWGESHRSWQFYQELRYNFSKKEHRMNGSYGASFRMENASRDYSFLSSEQDMVHLFYDTGSLVDGTGQPVPAATVPAGEVYGPLAGLPLNAALSEESLNRINSQGLDVFWDFNYQLTRKWNATIGVRALAERFSLEYSAETADGISSTLGQLTGNNPGLFLRPATPRDIGGTSLGYTARGGLKYLFSENVNVFAGYSRGRRPKVMQYSPDARKEALKPEIINSYELGLKASVKQRTWIDLGIYYHDYLHFQTPLWVATADSGVFVQVVKDAGKAAAYGAEANLKIAVMKGLHFFGNYAFTHALFGNTNAGGDSLEYSGNRFRLTPEHSFAAGLNFRTEIAHGMFLFAIPSFSWKSQVFFDDANTPGLEQAAYGLLNFRGGVELEEQGLTLSVFGNNLLGEEYIISAGNAGSLYGAPTQVPGTPRMFGAKIGWKFQVKQKPYYKRNKRNR